MEKWVRWRGRIPDVRHPEKVERRREKNSRCETLGWNGGGEGFQV